MLYPFTLAQVSVALGVLYLVLCGLMLWKCEPIGNWLKKAHRDFPLGVGLLVLAAGWVIWILSTMDLMEYTHLRIHFIVVVLIIAGLVIRFLPDYLSVRAYGVLLLLLSKVFLDAAFLRDEPAKFVIVILAYLCVVEGMFFVGAPYLFRDAIAWMYEREQRARRFLWFGIIFGVFLLGLGIFVY